MRAQRDARRLLNRLRADLLAVFPAAITIAADDMASPIFLKLLARWPSHDALAAASTEQIQAFARSARHGLPGHYAARVQQALAIPQLTATPYLAAAKTTPSG